MDALPIDPYLPEIVELVRSAGALVLSAPPGAGKTTRVPRALYDAGFAQQGDILILEPRRLAARLAAARVAQEFGEKVGETVGYSIRFETVAGPKTRIRFLTEAILSRRIVQDPNLGGVSAVILDEFHERHLATDLALAFLKQLQTRNPQLKIIVMSATLDAEPVALFLADARVLSISGSPYELSIEYQERASDQPVHERIASAVARLLRSELSGDILAFLPGAAEIRRSAEALLPQTERHGLLVFPLHGDLPSSGQMQAIAPGERKKVILATNVAETSITIPGIAAVIDSGLARAAGHSAWSGFQTLSTVKISKSSAAQRAGRAGRTQTGRALRLYTRADFDSRPEHEIPEVKRVDLAESVLMLHGAGIRDLNSFSWFEPPAKSALEAAETLLLRLGAVEEDGQITGIGRRMLPLPVHPRLARLIVEGEKLEVADECTLLASLMSERDIRLDARAALGSSKAHKRIHASGPSDLIELLDCFQEAEEARFRSERVLSLGLDPRVVQAVRLGQQQLCRLLSAHGRAGLKQPTASDVEKALLKAILVAFPDRVAKRRKTGSRELILAEGGSAFLSPASVVHEYPFVVAADAEERKEKRSPESPGILVRLASAIEPEWLVEFFPEAVSQKTELILNKRAGRVDQVQQTSYGQIALEETTQPADPSDETLRLLASAVFAHNLSPFPDASALPIYQARLALAAACFREEKFPEMGDREIRQTVEQLCCGKRNFAELASLSLVNALMNRLTGRQRAILQREAPEQVRLKQGRALKIHYEAAKPPWIASRLQDFFGQLSTPAICAGKVPLTIHLLAPNGRAVQVTQDLEGFWKRHYPDIRRELKRRYPKHSWPEDPMKIGHFASR